MKQRTLAKELIYARASFSERIAWDKEFDANEFAFELLIDRFKKVFVKTGYSGPLTVRILAKLFRVEFYVMMKRLTALKAL